jgi:malic enzyme
MTSTARRSSRRRADQRLQADGARPQGRKVVCNGAGAAAHCLSELIKAMGVPHENVIICDTKGVIYQGRTEGMNQWKSAHASTPSAHAGRSDQGRGCVSSACRRPRGR